MLMVLSLLPLFGVVLVVMGLLFFVRAVGAALKGKFEVAGGWLLGALACGFLVPWTAAIIEIRSPIAVNESEAIGDIRSMQSMQAAYAPNSGGAYGTLECLRDPQKCGFPLGTEPFCDRRHVYSGEEHGYLREFFVGPRWSGESKAETARTGVSRFAVVAAPVKPAVTGNRAFCGDDTGRICFSTDGIAPRPVDARCPANCQLLR